MRGDRIAPGSHTDYNEIGTKDWLFLVIRGVLIDGFMKGGKPFVLPTSAEAIGFDCLKVFLGDISSGLCKTSQGS
jgi:hypothetical protein